MKSIIILLGFVMVSFLAGAQQADQYSRAKIYLDTNGHQLGNLAALGLAVDHGEYKKNTYFTSDFSAGEIERAKQAGFRVEIIIADVSKYYADQNKKKAEKSTSVGCNSPEVSIPSHFYLGSYAGGYYTYTELLRILDTMQLLYPGLISVKQSIDTFHSIEGRPIYWVRISNNPTVEQPAKPQMLVTALHHAREPGSISATIFYMWYLLENYGTDARIKAIIDNAELYFVPCVNPDGYLYNIATSPAGGGMVRKNMRLNGDGTHGVDLNRNYGYMWGYDTIGSSAHGSAETYRGSAAFSEPETQAIKWFGEQHHFKLSLNYHSYNNDLIYPWGYIPSYQTPDSALFFAEGSYITSASKYRYGTCNQMLDYVSNGDSDDWFYGDTTTKIKAYSYTPEIGSIMNGFYPPTSSIIPDCQNNLISNINTASLLLPFATIRSTDEPILIQPSGYLHYDLQRLGFPDTATFTVQIIPVNGWMSVPATPKVYTGLAMLQHVADSISYTLDAGTPNGQQVIYVLRVNNGKYITNDTVKFYYGKYYTINMPPTDSLTGWVNMGWGVATTNYYTAPASIKSSIGGIGNYMNGTDITISTAHSIDLTHSTHASLQFFGRWALESSYDYVLVEAAPDGSSLWLPLCGKYTKEGSIFEASEPALYDGFQSNWVQEQIDLGDYLGQKINIQFELLSDYKINYDGFYFDDFEVRTVEDSTAFNHTGIKCVGATSGISIYPNPSKNEVTINFDSYRQGMQLHGVIYDCLGRVVKTFEMDKARMTIGVSQLPANVYYLKITDGNTVFPVQQLSVVK